MTKPGAQESSRASGGRRPRLGGYSLFGDVAPPALVAPPGSAIWPAPPMSAPLEAVSRPVSATAPVVGTVAAAVPRSPVWVAPSAAWGDLSQAVRANAIAAA